MSDLHADRREAGVSLSTESHLDLAMPESLRGQHPIAALEELIASEGLEADLLLCAGDLTHKAKPEPLQYAWRRIHEIGGMLGAKLVAATAGNHDLDSRYVYNEFDAKGMVQSLVPPFPTGDEATNDRYWSRHLALVDGGSYHLVLLNSAAYHGGAPEEIQRGRVSNTTLEHLRQLLEQVDRCEDKLNILLCHHHPERHPGLVVPDYEAMLAGPDLLELIGSGKYGRWLVIHGHKHNPRLKYAGGTAAAPVVFSAGSLSVVLYQELQNRVRNQFYLLSVHVDDLARRGLYGTGRAWDFIPGKGWLSAGQQSGLPAHFGFGSRTDPASWASTLNDEIKQFEQWTAVVSRHPELKYVLPDDLMTIESLLDRKYGINMAWVKGKPVQLGRAI